MIRILCISLDPKSTTRSAFEEEVSRILHDTKIRNNVYQFEFEVVPRAVGLDAVLLDYRPEIIQLSDRAAGFGPKVLSRIFHEVKLDIRCLRTHCVILGAGFDESHAKAIARPIESVLTLPATIARDSAIAFKTGFFEAIALGCSLQTSYELGCCRLDLDALSWPDIPQLRTVNWKRKPVEFPEAVVGLPNQTPGPFDLLTPEGFKDKYLSFIGEIGGGIVFPLMRLFCRRRELEFAACGLSAPVSECEVLFFDHLENFLVDLYRGAEALETQRKSSKNTNRPWLGRGTSTNGRCSSRWISKTRTTSSNGLTRRPSSSCSASARRPRGRQLVRETPRLEPERPLDDPHARNRNLYRTGDRSGIYRKIIRAI